MANLSRIAFVLRTIPNLNSEEITGIYPGELFLVGDKKAIFYKQEDGTVISPSEAASTFLTIEGNLDELPDIAKARQNLGIKSAALKDAGNAKGNLFAVGDLNSFLDVTSAATALDFNTYTFKSNEVIVLSKAAATNVPSDLDLSAVSIINVIATGTAANGGFVAFVSDMSNLKPSYLLRCGIANSVRTYSVEAFYTSKHKPSTSDLDVYSKTEATSKFLQISNLLSEITDADDKQTIRDNLDLGTASMLDAGSAKGNVIVVGDNGLGVRSNPVSTAKSVVPAFFQLAANSAEKPIAGKDYGFISFPISNTLTGYLRLSSDGELQLGIDSGATITYSKVFTGSAKPTLSELKALGSENNLSDLADESIARDNLGLGDSATKDVGTVAGSVAAGDDSRIKGAAQKDQNLSDLPDKAKARTALGLDTASQKKAQTSRTDVTVDSLMITGAFGLGGEAVWLGGDNIRGSFFDLFTDVKSGFYSVGALDASVTNQPPVPPMDIIFIRHNSTFAMLHVFSTSGESATALCSNNTWYSWNLTYSEINSNLILPIGVPIPYPLATPPKNFLKANGSTFDQVNFPKLLTVYPSGILPDLRGEFIRGWDDGRNIDTGRAILTRQNATGITDYQGDGITSQANYFSDPDYKVSAGGGFTAYGTSTAAASGTTSYYGVRPRNIAFNYIIRAK